MSAGSAQRPVTQFGIPHDVHARARHGAVEANPWLIVGELRNGMNGHNPPNEEIMN